MIVTKKKELDEMDKKIIELLKDNLTYKEIATRLSETRGSIRYRVRKMKHEFNCTTLAGLIGKITELSNNSELTKSGEKITTPKN